MITYTLLTKDEVLKALAAAALLKRGVTFPDPVRAEVKLLMTQDKAGEIQTMRVEIAVADNG